VTCATWEDAVRWLLAQPEQRQLVLDCFYDLPRTAAAARYGQSAEWRAVLALLPAQAGEALEIGAGHGIASIALAQAGWHVTALEPDPSDLVGASAIRQLAQACGVAVDVVEGFGEELPFEDASMDFVLARQVLHHARDLPRLCREVARVLRVGGSFLAMREHVISRKSDLPRFLDAHPLHRLYGGENAYLLNEYRGAMLSAGLRIERQLASFDSAINYAPHTRASLRDELISRAGRIPGGSLVLGRLLATDRRYDAFLRLLSRIDRRPGRLYSFVCSRPVAV